MPLRAPQRIYDFTDYSRTRPREQVPGDRLDAQFAEHALAIRSIIDHLRVEAAPRRPDELAELRRRVDAVIQSVVEITSVTRSRGEEAVARIAAALGEAQAAFQSARLSADALRVQRDEARGRLDVLQAKLGEVEERIAGLEGQPVLGPNTGGFYSGDVMGATATSADYAQVSIEWAEHMPDTIPGNILAINAITGQHWSSRWWASRSANAFGMLAWWYMGAWPQPGPPSTPSTPAGDPIPVGGMYFDTTYQVMMVWNGSTWINTSRPMAASTASLYYLANASQTVFPLTTPDRNGKTFAFNQVASATEGMFAFVNGVRLEVTYDYTVDTVNSVVTFTRPVSAQSLVIFDFLAPKASLAPSGAANALMLTPIVPDGVTTVFNNLTVASTSQPVNAGKSEELFVSVNGIPQQPGASYNAYGANITFVEAPEATAVVYIMWFGPPSAVGGSGTMASQNANAVAITGGNIDGTTIGGATPAAGTFTTLKANGATTLSGPVTASPANANVTISPTGTGTVSIAPAIPGHIDNTVIGAGTPAAVTATTLGATGAVTLSPAGANVTISPTGAGTVAINPATPGHVDNTIIGATVPAAATVTSLNGGPLAGTRNKLINGDMARDQRNTGAAQNAMPAAVTYTVDRWAYNCSQAGKFNSQQLTNATPFTAGGFISYQTLTIPTAYTTAATDYAAIYQNIEGFNVIDLAFGTAAAQPVTLSGWVASNVVGTHSGALCNQAGNRSYPFTFSIPAANAWTFVSVTIPGDTAGTWIYNNGVGLGVRFNLGSGANYVGPAGAWGAGNWMGATGAVNLSATNGGSFSHTGWQLERGSVATPFERRPIGAELLLCQRYYWQDNLSALTYNATGASNTMSYVIKYPVTMRAVPTGTFASSSTAAAATAGYYTGYQTVSAGNWAGTGLTTFSAEL